MSLFKNRTLRPAVAMLELIFALVIMGIAMTSIPNIVTTSIKSIEVSLQQEAISVAGSDISVILTHQWDEADANITAGAGILFTESAVSTLEANRTAINPPYARKRNINAGFTIASALGVDIGDNGMMDDVDDDTGDTRFSLYAGETASLSKNEGEYIDQAIKINKTIAYGSDVTTYPANPVVLNNPFTLSPTATSNIKLITITLTTDNPNTELQKNISLSAFSCNIGVASPRVLAKGL